MLSDKGSTASATVKALNPDLVIWVKYEFWRNHLNAIKERSIPLILVSAIFRKNQYLFKWYGKQTLNSLLCFNKIFVQDQNSVELLSPHGIESEVAGDTRIDNVLQRKDRCKNIDSIKDWKDKEIFLLGSVHPSDEHIYKKFVNEKFDSKILIVPHDVSQENVYKMTCWITRDFDFFSTLESTSDKDIIVVDKIGLLFDLYQYVDIAYIGGGFGAGIHNILEPLAHSVPVIIGPRYEKFKEASDLVNLRGICVIKTSSEFEKAIKHLDKNDPSTIPDQYMESNCGASEKIMKHILYLRS